MFDIPSISAIVAAIGVLIGVAIAVVELRNLVKTRQTDLVMRLYSQTCSKEMVEAFLKVMNLEFKDYNDFVQKHGPVISEKPGQTALLILGMFFEGVGVLLHRKLVDVDLIRELFGVGAMWRKVKPVVEGHRKQFNNPQFAEWFEYLNNEIEKREQSMEA